MRRQPVHAGRDDIGAGMLDSHPSGDAHPTVGKMLETYPLATMREGDTYILNDPYCGGTHLPDIAIMAPVFHHGRVIALSAAMTHHGDVGGMSAGSVPTNATEIFQEGVRIPPLKLREAGVYNDTLVRMLRQNVRMPDTFMGDINAQIAACNVGARRVAELADGYGAEMLSAIFDDLLTRSELMTRKALAAMPPGTYRYVDFLDNDGIELDKPIRLEVAVTIQGSEIEFDFEGTSPQVKGPLNCVRSGTLAPASPCAHSPIQPYRTTAVASGRYRCACPKAASSIRWSRRRSTRAPQPSSASPVA